MELISSGNEKPFTKKEFADMLKRSGTPYKRLQYILDDPTSYCYIWDRGWLTWKVLTNENERIFHITSAYNSPDTSLKVSKRAWDKVIEIAKSCKCSTMRLKTSRNPKAFERLYGFETILRTMEKKL